MTRDDTNENELHTLLGNHFRRRLDGQVGRAAAAFERDAATRPARGPWPLRLVFSGLAAAAAVAIAWATWPRVATSPQPSPPVIANVTPPEKRDTPRELERLVLWHTSDDGVGVLGDTLPVRKLRQEAVEQVRFYLPDERATVSVTTPIVRDVMVQMETY